MTITCYSGYGGTSNSNNNNNKYLTQRYMRSTHFHRLSFPTQTQNSRLNVTQGEIRLCRSSFFWHFLRRREVWWDPWFFCWGGRAIHHGGPAGKWLMLFCFRWTAEERRVSANIIVIYTVEMRRGGEWDTDPPWQRGSALDRFCNGFGGCHMQWVAFFELHPCYCCLNGKSNQVC